MSANWFGLIEMLLVFGLVALWCWNELRVLRRDNASAARRDAEHGRAPRHGSEHAKDDDNGGDREPG